MSKHYKVYTSDSPLLKPRKILSDSLMGSLRVRDLVWTLFVRDLKAQYRQSVMGYFWLFVPPLTVAGVWFFLNSQRIVRVETEIPYPLFVLIGTTMWTSFAALIQQPIAGFNRGKDIFIKLDVPPEAFIFSGILRAVFELGLRVLLIIPIFVLYKYVPPWTIWLLPLAVFSVIVPAIAIGVFLVPIGSLYGDVSSALSSFIGLLMYTVPVVYPVPDGGGFLASVLRWNPLTPGIALCRDIMVSGSFQWLPLAGVYFGLSVFLLIVGLLLVRVAKPHLVERMGM